MKKFIIFLFTLCVIALAAMLALKTIEPSKGESDSTLTESVFRPNESKPNESKPSESGPSGNVGDYEDWVLVLDYNSSVTKTKEFRITKSMWKKKTESGEISKIELDPSEIIFGN